MMAGNPRADTTGADLSRVILNWIAYRRRPRRATLFPVRLEGLENVTD